jgi:hypothetical protein
MGVHLVRYRCALSPISDIRDQRYRTELDIGTSAIGLKRVRVRNYIAYRNILLSDIRYSTNHRSAHWLRGSALASEENGCGIDPRGYEKNIL